MKNYVNDADKQYRIKTSVTAKVVKHIGNETESSEKIDLRKMQLHPPSPK